MNTPSPALLRRALKVVSEIEKLDTRIHQLLNEAEQASSPEHISVLPEMPEEVFSPVEEMLEEEPVCVIEEATVEVISLQEQESIASEDTPSIKQEVSDDTSHNAFVLSQEEQQPLFVEEAGNKPIVSEENAPLQKKKKTVKEPPNEFEQSYCLF